MAWLLIHSTSPRLFWALTPAEHQQRLSIKPGRAEWQPRVGREWVREQGRHLAVSCGVWGAWTREDKVLGRVCVLCPHSPVSGTCQGRPRSPGWVALSPLQGLMRLTKGTWSPLRKDAMGGGARPEQLTSWASGGRCPEASRGPACPWETYPPTAPGGPKEGDTADLLTNNAPSAQRRHLSPPSQPLFCQDPFHQFSSLDASKSYDVTNSQLQLLRETP